MTSGIKGTVYFTGVDCPPTVAKRVPPCSGPYPGYEVTLYAEDGKTTIKTVKTDTNGNYFVPLMPGNYIIYTQAGPLQSQKEANHIIVIQNQITNEDLRVETGVR